jgi:uncharacterized protein (TIGR04255 family)
MAPKPLKNKPLVEAILEVRWAVPPPSGTNVPIVNSDNKIFLGRFFDRVKERYPSFEVLPASAMPDDMVPHVAQYRFRKAENGWPLLQIGVGLLTLNETDSYLWAPFETQAVWALEQLRETFPGKLQFESIILRYIDAIEVDFTKESVLSFLKEKLKIDMLFPTSLFDSGLIEKEPTELALQSTFRSEKPRGSVQLKVGRGKVRDKDAVLLETTVVSSGPELPALPTEFSSWLESAHTITDDWFFKLIDGELLQRFE